MVARTHMWSLLLVQTQQGFMEVIPGKDAFGVAAFVDS